VPIDNWTSLRVSTLINVLADLETYLLDRPLNTSGEF